MDSSSWWTDTAEVEDHGLESYIDPLSSTDVNLTFNHYEVLQPSPHLTQYQGSISQRPLLPYGQSQWQASTSSDSLFAPHLSSSSNGDPSPEPLVRKGHTKSRRGCYSCKRRRVKCPEDHPRCMQCIRRGLKCEWPPIQFYQSSHVATRALTIPEPLKTPESSFTMQDFRFFSHFIQNCYPHQPIGNDSVWTHEVPSIAHNYDYLLHAMLGLSASDLAQDEQSSSKRELTATAISHRFQAIKSLNNALSISPLTSEQGNAMLATCYSLVFQSLMISDGLPEYMVFIRGCVLLMIQMSVRNLKIIFTNFAGISSAMETMGTFLDRPLKIKPEPLIEAKKSLEGFEHLCQVDWQKKIWNGLIGVVESMYTCMRTAYEAIGVVYGAFSYEMTNEEFRSFIDPSNQVSLILQSHLVAVSTLLGPVSAAEFIGRRTTRVAHISIGWLGPINANITDEMKKYIAWPMTRKDSITADQAKGILGRGYSLDIKEESLE